MPAPAPPAEAAPELQQAGGRTDRSTVLAAAAAVAVFGILVTMTGSWVPSAWADEGATMSGVRRSLPELWRMVHHVDGVHGAYYLLLHLWFDVVPYSPFTLRLPSAIAVGLAAGLTVLLVQRLAGTWTAVVAGVLTCCVPRLLFAGTEGRSSAASTLAAVGLTLVLVVALERTRDRRRTAVAWWIAYAVVAVVAGLLFVYTDLVVLAHAVTIGVLVLARDRRTEARAALWWAGAALVAGLVLLPFVRMVSTQTGQLYWMGAFRLDTALAQRVFIEQWFGRTGAVAVVPWALVVAGVVATLVLPRLRGRVPALVVALPIVVVPTVVVVVVSLVVRPLYDPRYLTFCSPFVAVLVALALTSVPWRAVTVVALVAVAALVTPVWVAQRTPTAKDGSNWAAAAQILTDGRAAEPPGTRDAIWYGPLPRHPNRTTEFVAAAYPDAFAGMRDLSLRRSAVSLGQLWAERSDVHDPLPSTDDVDRIWFVGQRTHDEPRLLQQQLRADGWTVTQRWFTGKFVILKADR